MESSSKGRAPLVGESSSLLRGEPHGLRESAFGGRERRKMTDVFCLGLFAVGMIAMFIIAIFAIAEGNLRWFYHSADQNGLLCGVDFPNRPFVLTYEWAGKAYDVCVEKCPTFTSAAKVQESGSYACLVSTGSNLTQSQLDVFVRAGECSPGVFATAETDSSYGQCVPYETDTFANFDITFYSADVRRQIEAKWKSRTLWMPLTGTTPTKFAFLLLLLILIASGLSTAWMVLVRFAATPIVWMTVLAVPLLQAGLACAFFVASSTESRKMGGAPANQGAMLACGFICLFFFMGSVAMIYFLRKRIRVAIEIIREASRIVSSRIELVAVPAVFGIEMSVQFIFYVVVAMYMSTATTRAGDERDANSALRSLQTPLAFLVLWNLNRIMATSRTIVAGVVAAEFWGDAKPELVGMKSIWNVVIITYRYHMGSIAFGSLVLAVIQMVTFFLMRLRRQLERSGHRVAVFMLACCQMMFQCLQRFVNYLTNMAYICVISEGTDFLTSARKSFDIISMNVVQIATVDYVADFVIASSKLFICCLSVAIAMMMFKVDESYSAVFIVWAAASSYMVSSCFMTVYAVTIDVLILGMCEDPNHRDISSGLRDALNS